MAIVQDPPPLPELDTVVLLHHADRSPLPRGAIGTVIVVHKGGEAYDVEWCDLDGRTVALLTMKRGELPLVQ